MSSDDNSKLLHTAIYRLCRPLVRILIRNGIPFSGFADIAKRAYVDVARDDFAVPGKKVSDSRISTITGLTRKEVRRVKTLSIHADDPTKHYYNRAARVIFGWIHDEDYSDEKQKPLLLPFEGKAPSFSELVKKYSGDVPPRAILDELEQVGVVSKLSDDRIKLMKRGYVPSTSEAEKLKLFGRDTAGLIDTIDRNIYTDKEPFYQRKVCYDTLSAESRADIRAALEERGQELLIYFDAMMSERDLSINKHLQDKGDNKAAGIGIYYFEDDAFEEKDK
jgi:hypothetical protein